jgi:hypothetical protein
VLPKIHSSAGDRVIGWISVDIFPVSGTCKGRMSIPAPYPVNRQDDPAADAAGLLLRIGLAVLAVGMPIAAILSRRAVFSLMPVGSVLILAAALVSPNPGSLMRLRGALRSPVGLASLFLIGWIALSLLWTPFFNLAAERLFKVAGTAALVTVASAFLPERTRVANLYLFPVGVSAATLLAIFIALRLQFFPPGTYDAESLTTDRAAITLVAFLWPSLAALAARQRFVWGGLLAVATTFALILFWTPVALAALAAGAITVAISVSQPRQASRILALVIAAIIIFAPLVALAISLDVSDHPGIFEPSAIWGAIIKNEVPRLVTGHGLDTAIRGITMGYLPPQTPRGILFECWYELGIVGALATAAVASAAFLLAGTTHPGVAPFLLAGLVSTLTIAIWSENSAQIWWVSLLGAVAIVFVCVLRGQYRTSRPAATVVHEKQRQDQPS